MTHPCVEGHDKSFEAIDAIDERFQRLCDSVQQLRWVCISQCMQFDIFAIHRAFAREQPSNIDAREFSELNEELCARHLTRHVPSHSFRMCLGCVRDLAVTPRTDCLTQSIVERREIESSSHTSPQHRLTFMWPFSCGAKSTNLWKHHVKLHSRLMKVCRACNTPPWRRMLFFSKRMRAPFEMPLS